MKKIILFIVAFLLSMLLFCLLAWLGGYNFDKRNADVSYAVLVAFVISGFGAAYISDL